MSKIQYMLSNMQIKLPEQKTQEQKESAGQDKLPVSEQDKKTTEKGTVTLSVEGVKRYEDAKAEAEENVPVLVKLLKAQLEKLQQRLVEIKKEIDALNANDSLDEETKQSMLAAKQDETAHIMGAIKEVNNALIEAMKPPENPEPVKNSE